MQDQLPNTIMHILKQVKEILMHAHRRKSPNKPVPPQRRHQYERGGTLCLRSGGTSGEKVNLHVKY